MARAPQHQTPNGTNHQTAQITKRHKSPNGTNHQKATFSPFCERMGKDAELSDRQNPDHFQPTVVIEIILTDYCTVPSHSLNQIKSLSPPITLNGISALCTPNDHLLHGTRTFGAFGARLSTLLNALQNKRTVFALTGIRLPIHAFSPPFSSHIFAFCSQPTVTCTTQKWSFAFSWVRGGSYGKFVEVSARVFISMDGTLFFSYNVREDEDSYACTLSLPATQSAQLGPFFRLLLPLGHIAPNLKAARGKGPHHHPHAFAPRIDEFQPQIFPEVPTRGDSVFLECFAYGFPVPTYQWSRADGQPLPSGRHRLLNFGRILRLDSAEMGDSSRYRCSVQNRLGLSSAEIRLTIHTPPALLRPLTSRMVAPGHSTTFQCPIADGAGMESLVEWFHDGVPLVPLLLNEADRRRFKLSGEGRELSILDVRSSDAGLIQCMASDDVGSVSSSALLVVATLSPRFHSNVIPSRLSIAKGAVLSLPCLFQSSPPGKGRWTKRGDTEKGQQIRSDRDQKLSGREIAVLNLRNVQMDDSGEYECEAVNNLGIAKAAVKVEVIEKPHVSVFAENSDWSNANQKFACEVEFRCASAEECPEGLFDWQFNDRPIRSLSGSEMIRIRQDDERMEKDRAIWVRQRSELEVDEHFAKGHVGRFSCHSLFGGATTELRPPSLAFASLVLSVVEVGTSDATLSWRILHNAPNGGQNSPKWRRFHEDKAAFGGQTFELELRTKSVRTWSVLKEVRVPGGTDWVGKFHMDGLEPNQRYQFRLRPTVEGARAISTSKWVKTDQSVPGEAVQNIRFRMLDDSRLLLEWDPVEKTHQSAPNLRYNVTWSTLTSWHSRMVTEPRLLIGLSTPAAQEQTNCALLEVGVRPENERGPGTERTNTVIRASAKEPQRYATDLRMDSVNATHLNLSWSWQNVDPCENAIGAKIMCEEVGKEGRQNSTDHQRPVDEHSPPHQSVPSEYTQWLVHSLRPLREYECRVVAFDQYGRMGPIRAVEVRGWTKERAPEGRPEISFVRSVELKLTAEGLAVHSAPNGSPTADDRSWDRGYKLFVYVSETAEQPILLRLTEAELNDPEKPSARVDGLRPMFFYTIQIAAFNSGGIGPLSERIPVRIGARHQLNPDLVTAMEGNGATSDGRGRRRMPFAMLRLLTTMASLIKLCRRHWR
uniref:Uncharacterized protein n=1 Tax=Globodera rostochiensis TaxID=31243 RepID=A0A914HVU1_GLORO